MGKGEELLEAVRQQDISTIQKILNKGKGKILGSKKINVNYQNHDGTTALHQAALTGNSDILCLLLDSHASVNLQDRKGNTPLHYSAWQGKSELVATLLQCGASHSTKAGNGVTPLHLSAQYGHLTTCKILLQYGADPMKLDVNQHSCLDLACEFGRLEVVELLLNCQFGLKLIEPYLNYSHENEFSHTTSPLHLAARNGHSNIIRALLQAGMNINWKCPSGTCLHEAVSQGKLGVVQLLVDCGIDATIHNSKGQTALEIVKQLPQNYPAIDIMKLLSVKSVFLLQVFAVNDFKNVYDKSSLAFTRGTIITVLEQNSSGNWKGRIDNSNGIPSIGYFPSAYVRPVDQDEYHASVAGSDDSGIHPYDDEMSLFGQPTHTVYSFPKTSAYHGAASDGIHKYVNMEPGPKPNTSQSRNQVIPNVNNPSYDDVIITQQVPKSPVMPLAKPISTSVSSEVPSLSKPLIANPGYEDVLLDCSPVSSSKSGASSNALTHKVNEYNAVQNQALPLHCNAGSPQMTSIHASVQCTRKTTKSEEEVIQWLQSINMGHYETNFLCHGYDMPTICHVNLSDLTALKIFNSDDRNLLNCQIHSLRSSNVYSAMSDRLPATLKEWLSSMCLLEYEPIFLRNGIVNIEKLLQSSWEDLQELKISKLGHQKKIAVGLKQLLQVNNSVNSRANSGTCQKTDQPVVSAKPHQHKLSSSSTPPTRTMSHVNHPAFPSPSTRKPDVRPKPKKMIPLPESPGLSQELLKALNKRQKVIDDAENIGNEESFTSSHVAPTHVSQMHHNAYVVNKVDVVQPSPPEKTPSPQAKKTAHHHRGPPPSPPKRTTSISLDESNFENNQKVVQSPVFQQKKNEGVKPNVAPKPHKPNKPQISAIKPNVTRKPTIPVPCSNKTDIFPNKPVQAVSAPKTETSVVQPSVTSKSEVGKRFDLSVLDEVSPAAAPTIEALSGSDEKNMSRLVASQKLSQSLDEFQWPAPPPPLPTDGQDMDFKMSEDLPRTETCFEEDIDTGTVKRRPSTNVLDNQQNMTVISPEQPASSCKANQNAPKLPPKRSSLRKSEENVPPPVPTKPENHVQNDVEEFELQENSSARKVLDDIGSMFDDLVNEFDEILG